MDLFFDFVAAKSFVAPIKRKSTPRVKLLGALILSRMLTSIKTIIAASNVYMWTDSAVVLHWLSKPSSMYKKFKKVCPISLHVLNTLIAN